MNCKKTKAFTLAEVLITLTIIGVIAALTIPNLMQSYKKHQVEVGVKEAYSILSNAIKMSEIENGSMQDWLKQQTNETANEWAGKWIVPYLKIANDHNKTSKQVMVYHSSHDGFIENIKGEWQNNAYGALGNPNNRPLTLKNGMTITISKPVYYTLIFHADINGEKNGPNRWGVDIFPFAIYYGGRSQLVAGLAGSTSSETILSKRYNSTLNDCTNNGMICARILQMNGWKIPDDYPVKKW